MWILNKTLLNNTWSKIISNTWVKEELSREISKYFELNENENIIYQNLWEAAKGVLRRNFTSLNAYIEEKKDLKSISKFPPERTRKRRAN